MEEQMLVNQNKFLLEEKIHELKVEIDKQKKENQEIKEAFAKLCQLCKVVSEYISVSGLGDKKQSTDYKLIDLGLPSGTLWMDRNIGATSPTDSGLYFAWGETTGYTADEVGKTKQFSLDDYKYHNKSKYSNDGYTDSLVTLQTTDDAVYQFTNGKCSMPTKEQFEELLDNTTYKWATQDGVNGGLFTSKINGKSIFVPAVGGCSCGFVNCVGNSSHLWSSSLCENYLIDACGLYFGDKVVVCDCYYGYYGFPVRGVVGSVE